MGVRDIRFGDAFTSWVIGFGMGAVALFVLSHVTGVKFRPVGAPPDIKVQSKLARAYPSYFWDLRDPGASQANFDQKDYYENSIPREGLFQSPDPDFTQVNFSEAYGNCPYQAPRSL